MKLILLFFLFVFTSYQAQQMKSGIPIEEWNALKDFYDSSGGANWTRNDNWLSDKPVTTWYGIKDGNPPYDGSINITSIVLPNNNLKGDVVLKTIKVGNRLYGYPFRLDLSNNLLTSIIVGTETKNNTPAEISINLDNNQLISADISPVGPKVLTNDYSLSIQNNPQLQKLKFSNINYSIRLDIQNLPTTFKEAYYDNVHFNTNYSLDFLSSDRRLDVFSITNSSFYSGGQLSLSMPKTLILENLVDLRTISSYTYLPTNNVSSASIKKLQNLNELSLNGKFSNLAIEDTPALTRLSVTHSNLTTRDFVNFSKLPLLTHLDMSFNNLSNFQGDAALFPKLTNLAIMNNTLGQIDIKNLKTLENLKVDNNDLNALDVSENNKLTYLSAAGNALSNIDISSLINLASLNLDYNTITDLDVSKSIKLQYFSAVKNKLKSINLDNLTSLTSLYLDGNPFSNKVLNLNNNSSLSSVSAIDTNLEVVKFKNYTQYTNNDISFGNSIKCIEVDNPDRSRAWEVNWASAYYNNYNTDCTAYLGIKDVKISNLKILNPVLDILNIQSTDKIKTVEIFDATGRLIKTFKTAGGNVSDLAKGIYIVKITTDTGIISQKIIKQ